MAADNQGNSLRMTFRRLCVGSAAVGKKESAMKARKAAAVILIGLIGLVVSGCFNPEPQPFLTAEIQQIINYGWDFDTPTNLCQFRVWAEVRLADGEVVEGGLYTMLWSGFSDCIAGWRTDEPQLGRAGITGIESEWRLYCRQSRMPCTGEIVWEGSGRTLTVTFPIEDAS